MISLFKNGFIVNVIFKTKFFPHGRYPFTYFVGHDGKSVLVFGGILIKCLIYTAGLFTKLDDYAGEKGTVLKHR